jgi:hypothetical protein
LPPATNKGSNNLQNAPIKKQHSQPRKPIFFYLNNSIKKMEQTENKFPYHLDFSPLELQVINCILKYDKGLMIPSKKDLKDYPTLINNQLVYIETIRRSTALKPTDKGMEYFNNLIQQ